MVRAWLPFLLLSFTACADVLGLDGPQAGPGGPGSPGTTARACTGTTAKGSCYERHKLASSWMAARDLCEADGGWLVTVGSLDEATVLSNMMTTAYGDVVYVGASDFDTGKFTWLDGTEPLASDWFPSQPDYQKDEHCGVTRDIPLYAFGLEDHICNDVIDYICERPTP